MDMLQVHSLCHLQIYNFQLQYKCVSNDVPCRRIVMQVLIVQAEWLYSGEQRATVQRESVCEGSKVVFLAY